MSKLDDNIEKIIKYPQKGKELFIEDEDYCYDARINNTWEVYANGYKDAADLLISSIFENPYNKNWLVYPIIFLYRHYIELRIKEIIIQYDNLTYHNKLTDKQRKFLKQHELDELWKICKTICQCTDINIDKEVLDSLDATEEYIKHIVQIDNKSQSFRYPIDKNGKSTIANIEYINLRNLYERIYELFCFLECISIAIYLEIEHKRSLAKDLL